ncbi:perilipin-3-like [Trichosurus vulpecula]|uniref:perilipin-3-like n=1 Tax=Trichosurus vulpecula TaxID=9337 RepID=UPI00186B40E5|nr:perilipin-3-like [Trichosurus vulpecula]
MSSSAHAAEKPGSQSVLAPVCNIGLASPNKDLATSALLKGEHSQMQSVDDATEENLKTSEGVVEGREPSPSQVTASPAAVLSLASSAKNVVASRGVQATDVTEVAVQSGLDMTKSMFATNTETFFNDRFDQMILKSTDNVLKQSEERNDNHLPMTDDELAEIATTLEGLEIPTLQQQRETQQYFVHLGSLPPNLHQQAVQYSLVKLGEIKQSALEIHLQLSQIISMINNVKQTGAPFGENQEKLHQIWNRMVPGNIEQDAGQIESRFFILFMKVLQQLLDVIFLLLSNIQGFNDGIERKIKQMLHRVEDLEATLVGVHSFQDLSCIFITMVDEENNKILPFLQQIYDYLAKDRPLTWIVGPFVPSSQCSQKAEEASQKIKEE